MERKDAEKFLLEAEERLKEIYRNINDIEKIKADFHNEIGKLKTGKEFIERYKKVVAAFPNMDELTEEKNSLSLERYNLERMECKAAFVVISSEIENMPLKAAGKPIYYKVFQDELKKAIDRAFSFLGVEEHKGYNGNIYKNYKFHCFINRNGYGYSAFSIDKNREPEHFYNMIDNDFILNSQNIKAEAEKISLPTVGEVGPMIREAVRLSDEYDEKISALKKERKEAMEKFSRMTISLTA